MYIWNFASGKYITHIVSSDILNQGQGRIVRTNIDVAYTIFPRLNDGVTTIFPSQPETPREPGVPVMPPLSVFNEINE